MRVGARDDGLPAGRRDYTVRQAVESSLEHRLAGRDRSTVRNRTILARRHVLPALGLVGWRKTADEVDRWLTGESKGVSTDTLAKLLSILRQSIRRAQARDLVQRNVALLSEGPKGTVGRPSKSLSLEQASRLLMAAEGTSMHAYVVVSLLTGACTEELRALTWSHLDLEGDASGLRTGFEPVTSSVSGQRLCVGMRASVGSGASAGSPMSATVRSGWPTVWPTVNRRHSVLTDVAALSPFRKRC
jgi:hypothetical protein